MADSEKAHAKIVGLAVLMEYYGVIDTQRLASLS